MLLLKILLLICIGLSFPANALSKEDSFLARIQNIQPALVDVRTVLQRTLTTKDGRKGIASYERHGTGVIVDPSGIIVTNTHIVLNAPQILIALSNGKVYEATVIGVNEADFSFLKINTPFPLLAIEWADSFLLELGTPIIALGNSEFNTQSILGGEVTSLLESMSNNSIEMIEINLNLYQGDSGGPILDRNGRLLGLIMGKRKSQERKSYAIASNKIRQEYLKLKQKLP